MRTQYGKVATSSWAITKMVMERLAKSLFTGYQFRCKKEIDLDIVTSSLSQGLAKPFMGAISLRVSGERLYRFLRTHS